MALNTKIFAQNSFGLTGYWGLQNDLSIPYYSYESNTSNSFNYNEWGISLSYGAEFSSSINSSLYLLAIAKRLGDHSLSARFTPGYQKEFLFSTGEVIIIDTTSQSLKANYNYKELFGLGYSYNFNPQFNAGFTIRFFNQDFNQEIVKPVFGDTLEIVRETINEKVNFWKADLGFDFILNDVLRFRAASINLINFGDMPQTDEFIGFEMKQDMGAMFSASYTPLNLINLNLIYETSQSFQINASGFAGNFTYGLTTFHDKYQDPFIAGVIPAFGYRTNLFEVLLSGVKYFSDRTTSASLSQFAQEGIHNVINNRYSFDKVVLSLALKISSSPEQKAKFIDVEIVRDIYPTFFDNYLENPVAFGKVINLTDEPVSIMPSAKIEGMHNENIQSAASILAPGDTAKIPYYIIIPENFNIEKAILSYADFYISTTADEPDDHLQKAILVNGVNAWDGRVSNLKYFIKKNIDFSMSYSKGVLSANKETLDTVSSVLSTFYKASLLFDNFVKQLVYTSDPRASAEYVQFPKQTLELKGGDCDDLSVVYSSLLESVGIQTALVDYKSDGQIRHVSVLFNTELLPNQAKLITDNDKKYFLRENQNGFDEVWLPVEATSLTNFYEAWNKGVEKFNHDALNDLGIAKGKVEIIDVY
ncbi:MAG: hypothetical protein KJN64_14980 [Ignavibacteria bacterium]|nr:hypothetical protein [Ignavibacteria bacterium]MBT8382694.1 hypothetical protein [Ignavibacteria bacterium]MBT8391108.1 hypothetical protein [Ignavibacteria bacterium]NNJ53677.1 hypothetical protein [Ignavibacteriaceae bacterium]NNL19699.1 hypothetical protein [Ignavibacteriaceae bacterium]